MWEGWVACVVAPVPPGYISYLNVNTHTRPVTPKGQQAHFARRFLPRIPHPSATQHRGGTAVVYTYMIRRALSFPRGASRLCAAARDGNAAKVDDLILQASKTGLDVTRVRDEAESLRLITDVLGLDVQANEARLHHKSDEDRGQAAVEEAGPRPRRRFISREHVHARPDAMLGRSERTSL